MKYHILITTILTCACAFAGAGINQNTTEQPKKIPLRSAEKRMLPVIEYAINQQMTQAMLVQQFQDKNYSLREQQKMLIGLEKYLRSQHIIITDPAPVVASLARACRKHKKYYFWQHKPKKQAIEGICLRQSESRMLPIFEHAFKSNMTDTTFVTFLADNKNYSNKRERIYAALAKYMMINHIPLNEPEIVTALLARTCRKHKK